MLAAAEDLSGGATVSHPRQACGETKTCHVKLLQRGNDVQENVPREGEVGQRAIDASMSEPLQLQITYHPLVGCILADGGNVAG